jgi:hypothetical protein
MSFAILSDDEPGVESTVKPGITAGGDGPLPTKKEDMELEMQERKETEMGLL